MNKNMLISLLLIASLGLSGHALQGKGKPKPIKTTKQKDIDLQFIEAVEQGNLALVQALIKKGANVNAKDSDTTPVLICALYKARPKIALELIKAGADTRGYCGNQALILAAEGGYLQIVQALIKAGANVNAQNDQGYTALMRTDNLLIAQILIKAGANVNAKNTEDEAGDTVLIQAAAYGDHQIVKTLIKAGANVNAKNNYGETALVLAKNSLVVQTLIQAGAYDNTALMNAARSNNLEMVQMLIKAGANVNTRDQDDLTVLMHAAVTNSPMVIIQALIQAGADINAITNKGDTALMFAARFGHLAPVKELIKAGAHVNIKNCCGQTPLILATDWLNSAQNNHEVVQTLINAGAHVNVEDCRGFTPLILAAKNGSLKMVQALIQAGADVNAQKYDNTAAYVEKGSPQLIKMLISRGLYYSTVKDGITQILPSDYGSFTLKEYDGATALMYAVERVERVDPRKEHIEIAKVLLQAGAHINTKTSSGRTALICAADNAEDEHDEIYLTMIQILIKANADINIKDKYGYTALDYATKNTNQAIINLLEQAQK